MKTENLMDQLKAPVRKAALHIAGTLTRAGYECWMVGGTVRDLLMNRPGEDLDITTNAPPDAVISLFQRTVPTGIAHGTVTVLLDKKITDTDGILAAEVTTYRSESEYSDGRRPDSVSFSSTLSEDLMRRDFTVNAIALNPLTGELTDEHGGMKDLESRIIRTIGRPEDRFMEDGLRPVRACRFTATLGFSIESATLEAIRQPEVLKRAEGVAPERFTDELRKGFRSRNTSRMLISLQDTGLLGRFLKLSSVPYRTLSARQIRRIDDAFDGSISFRMAVWFRMLGIDNRYKIAEAAAKLRLSGAESKDIENYIRYIEFQERPASSLLTSPLYPYKPEEIRFFLSEFKDIYRNTTKDFISGAATQFSKNIPKTELLRILDSFPLIITDLKIGGRDLMDAGTQGPEIGRILKKLQLKVIMNPELNNKETLLQMIRTG